MNGGIVYQGRSEDQNHDSQKEYWHTHSLVLRYKWLKTNLLTLALNMGRVAAMLQLCANAHGQQLDQSR